MRMERIASLLILLSLAPPPVHSANERPTAASSAWRVAVLPGSIPPVAGQGWPVWLGVKNSDTRPMAICLRSASFTLLSPDDDAGITGGDLIGREPHACSSGSTFHLVLPGESFFVRVLVDIPADAHRQMRLQIHIECMVSLETATVPGASVQLEESFPVEVKRLPPKK
jgi:hypothetical protein